MGRSPLSFVTLYFEFNFVKKNIFEKKLRSEPVKLLQQLKLFNVKEL